MVIHTGEIEHCIDILKLSVTVFDCVDTFLGVDSVNALRRCTVNALRLSRHVSHRSNAHCEWGTKGFKQSDPGPFIAIL